MFQHVLSTGCDGMLLLSQSEGRYVRDLLTSDDGMRAL